MTDRLDPELLALNAVFRALDPLTPSQRQRIVAYLIARHTGATMINGLPEFREARLRPVKQLKAAS